MAITTAVVGILANLALFFACHALLPNVVAGGIDVAVATQVILACIALMGFRRGVSDVIVVSAC